MLRAPLPNGTVAGFDRELFAASTERFFVSYRWP